jgi:alkylmercury lyase
MSSLSDGVIAAFPRLSELEARVSLALYRLLAQGRAVDPKQISAASQISTEVVRGFLERWHGVKRNADGAVIGYWGLTLTETKHRLRLDGRQVYAWCAWDTLFIPPLLDATAHVESVCPVSKEAIALNISPSGIESVRPEQTVISFVVPERVDIEKDVIKHFCSHVHFFASRELGEEWAADQLGTLLLTLNEAWQIGLRKNAAQYCTTQVPSTVRVSP